MINVVVSRMSCEDAKLGTFCTYGQVYILLCFLNKKTKVIGVIVKITNKRVQSAK